MQKILHVVTKSSWGGAQKYVIDLVTGLQNDYDQIVAYGANTFDTENIFEKKLSDLGIPKRPIYGLKRDITFFTELGSFLKLYRLVRSEQPDVIHLNSPKAAGLGSLCARLVGTKKIVYTVHGLALAEPRPQWQKKIIAIVSWVTFMLSHDIIFVSQSEFNLVKHWRGVKRKSHVIHNGIPDTEFLTRNAARALIEKRGRLQIGNRILIGSIGELTNNKGQIYTLEALALLEHKDWIYLHWGAGELLKDLQKKSQLLGISDNVFFMGFDAEAKTYLSALDIFILSSVKEGLGYVLLEAGQASLAVAASDVGGIPEIIEHEKTGLLSGPGDAESLSIHIDHMLQNTKARDSLGAALQEHVSKNFSVEKMINETKKVYS